MTRFARIDLQIRANRLILVNRFWVPELNPFFCKSRFWGGGGKSSGIAGLRRFVRIARTL